MIIQRIMYDNATDIYIYIYIHILILSNNYK